MPKINDGVLPNISGNDKPNEIFDMLAGFVLKWVGGRFEIGLAIATGRLILQQINSNRISANIMNSLE